MFMPLVFPALVLPLRDLPPPGPPLSAQGELDAAETWVASSDRQLWVCWQGPPATPAAEDCWVPIPEEHVAVSGRPPTGARAVLSDLDAEAPRWAHPLAVLRKGEPVSPRGRVLGPSVVAFVAADGSVWLFWRNGVLEPASSAGWSFAADDIPPLTRPRCSSTGWTPRFRRGHRDWVRTHCRAVATCSRPRASTRNRPPSRGVRVDAGLELWRRVDWKVAGRGEREERDGGVLSGFHQSVELGAWIFVRVGFDPLRRRVLREAVASVERTRATPRIPDVPSGPLSGDEEHALSRLICSGENR
ncbi:MAG: hypothetical protein V3V08_01900 [Nannocystaceae bacterium]